MATDLKLEIFAYDIFQTVFQSHRLIQHKPNVFEIYGTEGLGDPSYAEVYDDLFHKAIFCRRELFQNVYKSELMYEKIEICRSPTDLFDYLINRCDQDYLFHNLNVFEKMFATCAFVVSMCVHIYWYNVVDVISYGHLFWAIFFDKYTEDFYEKGGWDELKRVAKTYEMLYEFLAFFPENFDHYFRAIKEATENYRHFKEVNIFKKHRHVSKKWVRFHIENFENYVKIPASYEVSLKPINIELLLMTLKQFCNPRPKEALEDEQFRDSGSEISCFNGFISTTDDSISDDMFPKRYQVKKVNKFVYGTDNSSNSTEDSDNDNISQGTSKVKGFNDFELYTEDSSSFLDSDSDDMSRERCQRRYFSAGMASDALEIGTEIKTEDNDPSIRPFLFGDKNTIVDTFSGNISNSSIEYNKKLQRETSIFNSEVDIFDHLNKNEILEHENMLSTNASELGLNIYLVNKQNIFVGKSTNQPFEPITEKFPNTKGLDYFIVNYNRNPDSRKEIGITNNLNSRNASFQRETADLVEGMLEKEMVKSVLEGNSPLKNLRTPKEFNPVNEHINFDGERKNTEKIENVSFDTRKRKINETVKPMNVLYTNLKTTSERNAERSPDIAHNSEDFDLLNGNVSSYEGEECIIKTLSKCFDARKRETNENINPMVASKGYEETCPNIADNSKGTNHLNATVKSEDERKITQRKLYDPSFNQFSRTIFKPEDMGAIGYIRTTSFTKEAMVDYLPESLKSSKKRTGSEQEAPRKKFFT